MHHSLGCAVHRSVVVNALEMLGSMSAKGRKRAGVSLRKGEGLLRSVLENAGTL